MCSPYAGGRGRWVLFAGGVRSAGGDSLRASLYASGAGGGGGDALCALCMLEVLEMPEMIRCVLLCMLQAVEGRLCLWMFWRCRRCWR